MGTADADGGTCDRILDPVDRISEIMFGLIMALTFTGLIGASLPDDEINALLLGAIGCNLAWGLVDGVMFVLMGLIGRGHGLRILRSAQASDPVAARAAIRDSLDPLVGEHLDDDTVEGLRRSLARLDAPDRPLLRGDDLRGALGVALLVFLSTLPVVVPFAFMDDVTIALRISNGIAIAMLFACGFQLGAHAGVRRWRAGAAVALLGTALVPITIALGG
jgi:VIT1/CCC1 family predicted Fe2+/Mn2+ transporter